MCAKWKQIQICVFDLIKICLEYTLKNNRRDEWQDFYVMLCFMLDEKSFTAVKEDIEKKFPTVRKEDFLQHVQSLHADSDVGFSHEFDVSTCTALMLLFPSTSSTSNMTLSLWIFIILNAKLLLQEDWLLR